MHILINYIIVLLTIIFIVHLLSQYRRSSNEEIVVNLGLSKIIIFGIALVGHGSIIATVGVTNQGIQILALNLLVIITYTILSHSIDFLEPVIWHIISFLHLIGSLMLHRLNPELSIKHNMVALLGFIIMIIIGFVVTKLKFLDKLSLVYMFLAIGLLLIVNSTTNGATNWFEYGNVSFQPSEFVKIIFAFYLASIFKKKYNFTHLVIGSFVSAIIVLILVYQRDLGSAFLFYVLYMVISYMYSRKRWLSFVQLGALAAGGFVAYTIFTHVQTRILAWLDPFAYIDNQGYQMTQGLFAFASGKWMGTGITQGFPTKIPVVTTDFIYAAIGEEFGTVFTLLLIIIYLILIILLLSQCQKTNDIFKAYVGVGLVVMFGFQGFLIIGGVIKLIPLTGVTLPFISYGGTSLVATIISLGIVEAITKSKNVSEVKEYRSHTIITLKIVMVFLYMLLFGYLLYFITFQSEALQLNSYNNRLDIIEKTIQRGTIYDENGVTLAYSKFEDNKFIRVYPYKEMFAHAIGYSQVGKTGVEAYMNVELLSSNNNFFDQVKHSLSGVKPAGSDIYLTLNYELQKIAYHSLEGKKGAVIAMDPSTGKILAMVSKPDFDPNQIEAIYQDLLAAENGVLLNRTTNGLYPPGSTFKTITAISYIHEHGEDFYYFCQGRDIFANKYIHCYGDTAHGRVDIKDAFAVSCNTAFATMGEGLDLHKFELYTNDLLFNQELPYDYDHVTSSFILPETVSGELRAETVIGQGEILISPLHNLLITSAIANGGQLMKPYLVDSVVNKKGTLISKNLPVNALEMFNTSDSLLLKDYMEAVVLEGTGKGLLSTKYTAAGKTGSAENPFGDTHAWFVGFAPVENPKIAVAIIVENSGSSSANSIPIAKELFDYYLGSQ